ncbi:choice-of-anchor D domain-containing protein [candidate division KSB1 bacterium]|nr:choice-of-anchor D domain-containing protein [candidate division KSB1 bacterium]
MNPRSLAKRMNITVLLMALLCSNSWAAGSFSFNDGTTQGWTLDQMYVTSSQTKFTPVIGYTLMNSDNELSAYSGSLLIGRSDQNDIYLESPDVSANSSWQGISGYSVNVRRTLYSPCWGDFANIFFVQLQIKVIDTGDANKEKLFAEHDGTNFVFHDITNKDRLYQFTWQPSWLTDPRYKVKKIRIRITGPGDVMAECWYRGSWRIDNVNATGGTTNNTNPGTNVQVNLGSGVNVTFDNVTGAGNTSMTTSSNGTPPPNGFTVVPSSSPVYYSITTTATYSGKVKICIQYNDAGMTAQQEAALNLRVYETPPGQWKNITSSINTSTNIICGIVTHFSEFAVMSFSGGAISEWILTNDPSFGTINCFTVSGTNLFAGTEAGGVFLSTNNGVTWNQVNTGITNTTIRALCASGTNIFAGTWGGGVFLSTNNGTSWTAVNAGLTDLAVAMLYSSGTNLLAGTWGGGVFRSTNNGTSWTAINTGLTETHIRAIYIGGSNFYAGTISGLFLSTNNGTSWTAINSGLTSTSAISLAGIPVGSNEKLFTGTSAGGVFLSINNGGLWSAVNTGLTTLHVPFLTVSTTNLFAATWGDGVFLTPNNGTSWTGINDGLTNLYIRSLTVCGTDLFAGTNDGGIWRRPLSTMITSVPDINVNPTSWNYGSMSVGNYSDKTFVVSNTGAAELNVTATTLGGANQSEFSIQSGGGSFTLAPAGSRNLTIRFAPTGAGSKSASLSISSNDPDENPLVIALSGQGVAVPVLSVNPTTLDFGIAATTLTFQIANNGGGSLTWTVAESPDKAWITTISPKTGTNSATISVSVDRGALSGNSDTGTLAVTSNGGNQNVTVNISKQAALPANWNFKSSTGNSASVVLPTSANPNIDGVPLQNGDYIGVFTPAGLCCGWKQWAGANISITAWGDDDQTTQVDGFKTNEELKYRVYRSASTKEWEFVTVAYSQGTGKYTKDALMILSKFDVTGMACRALEFAKGWNMISINVTPVDPNIAAVMAPIVSKLVIVKSSSGKTYIPAYGINDIGNMQFDNGYQAYVTDAAALNVCGAPVEPTTPISLPSGWSIISYLPAVPVNITTALSSISSKLVIAKNNLGQTYIPAYGINDIGQMQPGQGYQVYLSAAGTLTYPATLLSKATVAKANAPTEHFSYTPLTGQNATVVVPIDCNPRYSDESGLQQGDEIGVFTSNGLCCGAAIWEGTNEAITVWGDNDQTPAVDGFVAGDTLRFRVWKKAAALEYPASVAFQTGQPVVYQTNGLSVLTNLVANLSNTDVSQLNQYGIPEDFRLYQNHPNPFNAITTISFSLPEPENVVLRIFDSLGREVSTVVNKKFDAGTYTVAFDASDEASGIYFYHIQAGKFTDIKKCVLIK